MSERLVSPATYIIVLLILIALTILTVGLSFAPFSPAGHIIAGQSIAVVKAALVVLFFMHALHSTGATRAVIAVTIFWLVVVFFSLTMADYLTRDLLPSLPGH